MYVDLIVAIRVFIAFAVHDIGRDGHPGRFRFAPRKHPLAVGLGSQLPRQAGTGPIIDLAGQSIFVIRFDIHASSVYPQHAGYEPKARLTDCRMHAAHASRYTLRHGDAHDGLPTDALLGQLRHQPVDDA